MNDRRVVMHADDLGMSRAVSEGILRGFSHGLLTSTSLLANAPDAARAMTQWTELARAGQAGELHAWSGLLDLRHRERITPERQPRVSEAVSGYITFLRGGRRHD